MHIAEILSHRVSCRKFTEEKLTQTEIAGLLTAGNAAPIGMNRKDDYRLLVIQNPDVLKRIEAAAQTHYAAVGMKMLALYNAPALIAVAIKKQGPDKIPPQAYANSQYCTAACILENMIIAATEQHLGTVFLTGFTTAINHNPSLLADLHLNDDYIIAAGIALGHPAMPVQQRDISIQKIQYEYI